MTSRIPRSTWRLVVVDATSGVPLVAGAISVVAALMSGFALTTSVLLPGWADPLNATLSACFFMCPLAAGTAAVHAGRLRRSGVTELALTAPDGVWRTLRVAGVASGLWSLAAYGCLIAVVLLSADLNGPFSLSMLLLPLEGAVLLVAGTAVGVLTGAVVSYVWAPPLVATVVYVALNYLDRTTGPLDRYSVTYAFVFYQNNLVPNAQLVLGTTTLGGAVGLIAVAMVRGKNGGWKSAPWAVAALVVVVGGLTAVEDAPPGEVQYRSGETAACAREASVGLCVFAESAPQLRPMVAALARARSAALPVFEDVPTEYRQPLVRTRQDNAAPADIPPNAERFGYLGRAIEAVVPADRCLTLNPARDDLIALVYERIQPNSVQSESVRRVARGSDLEQSEWVSSRLAALRACQ